jgi:hypothetical protein
MTDWLVKGEDPVRRRRRVTKQYDLECQHCKKPFKHWYPLTKYCMTCGTKRPFARIRKLMDRLCKHCEDVYTPTHGNQRYCKKCKKLGYKYIATDK